MAVDTQSRWLRRYAPVGVPRLRLLCLPHAGGTASFFHSWGSAFGPDVEVLVARYPGRLERIAEPCLGTVEELADALAEAVEGWTDLPLAVFGHSMGASVGYELTLRLVERYGVAPSLLLVSGRRPPHTVDPSRDELDDEGVVAEVRRLGGTDASLFDEPGLRELVLPAIRADFAAVAAYRARPGVPLPCPVVGYVGDADPEVDRAAVERWADLAPLGFDSLELPGDHFYLLDQREPLIDDIRARLVPRR
ncbi:thioesterase II family protein [Streptomyces profundus]|uniref:thioesterase II family protein n=1 Tax=Streptomyces profundus TaxID=2867410 RepID=UPI001D169562|nr:alpha/beta fold hydrolase [Streptomyces sp. MA3_2.13]UED87035.1 alpha/beta fold hydrolase [Streptomyces sp. MA3_2.13]